MNHVKRFHSAFDQEEKGTKRRNMKKKHIQRKLKEEKMKKKKYIQRNVNGVGSDFIWKRMIIHIKIV